MLTAILVIVCVTFVVQCCVFNKAASEKQLKRIETLLEAVAGDVSGATRNSAECYNVVRQIHTDIRKSADDLAGKASDAAKGLSSSADGVQAKLLKAVKATCGSIEANIRPSEEALKSKMSEMNSAVDALIDSVTITRNSDGVVPTALLKDLVEATDKEDQEKFAESIGKAKAFLDLYEPVAGKIVREKAIKKVAKRKNYGFF